MAQTSIFRGTARNIITTNGRKEYVYHKTAVVTVHPNGAIELSSGGWRTATTKTAMNQASTQDGLGFQVFQKAGEWFVIWKGITLGFYDGMILD